MNKIDSLVPADDRSTAQHEINLEPAWVTILGGIVAAILFYLGLAAI